MSDHSIRKAALADLDAAYCIVGEYYEAAHVVARDDKAHFCNQYFGERSGFWMAFVENEVVGCVTLRELSEIPQSAEIKRLYVQPSFRKHGIAQSLLHALENFAAASYDWLYLDSAAGMHTAIRFYQRNGYQPCSPYNN